MEKLLTIAVPTYNIPDYIEKNIRSFQSIDNDYKNLFEVLIINDGSVDNTVQIVEELISKDLTLDIRLINKENGGHGSAVNRGIEEAQGKYFKVIDGDDWVKKDVFQNFLEKLKELSVDMIITDFTEIHTYNNTTVPIMGYDGVENQVITGIPTNRVSMHAVTFKTSILKDHSIKLTEKTFYVDIQYTLFPLPYVQDYLYLKMDLYQYLIGRPEQSMNVSSLIKNSMNHLTVTNSILNFYGTLQSDSSIKHVVETTLDYLINMQVFISSLSDNRIVQLKSLLATVDRSSFNLRFGKGRNLLMLEWLNYKLHYKMDRFIKLLSERLATRRFKRLSTYNMR